MKPHLLLLFFIALAGSAYSQQRQYLVVGIGKDLNIKDPCNSVQLLEYKEANIPSTGTYGLHQKQISDAFHAKYPKERWGSKQVFVVSPGYKVLVYHAVSRQTWVNCNATTYNVIAKRTWEDVESEYKALKKLCTDDCKFFEDKRVTVGEQDKAPNNN